MLAAHSSSAVIYPVESAPVLGGCINCCAQRFGRPPTMWGRCTPITLHAPCITLETPPKLLSGPHITPDRGWPSSLPPEPSLLLYRPNGRTFNFRRIHFAKLNNYGFIALVSFVLCGSKTIVLYVSGVFISHDFVLIV